MQIVKNVHFIQTPTIQVVKKTEQLIQIPTMSQEVANDGARSSYLQFKKCRMIRLDTAIQTKNYFILLLKRQNGNINIHRH